MFWLPYRNGRKQRVNLASRSCKRWKVCLIKLCQTVITSMTDYLYHRIWENCENLLCKTNLCTMEMLI